MSDYIDKFIVAYANARRTFPPTGKSKSYSVGGRAIRYANLEDVYNAVLKPLDENEITAFHMGYPHSEGKEVIVTRLIHRPSGQWIQDVRYAESEKPGNQEKGKANTYMKRYALLALCGISAEEDDDGQAEQTHIEKRQQAPTYKPRPKDTIDTAQASALIDELDRWEREEPGKGEALNYLILQRFKAPSFLDIKSSDYDEALGIAKYQ